MSINNILSLCCGLGMFLFGMNYMGEGLQRAAGAKMKDLMEKLTRNPVRGFLLGMLVTAVIQSSSATSVMAMGMINAGIMDLAQATGVILGANIGTTMTSILIALDASLIAPACIFIGAMMILFCKKNTRKYVGQVILGFGLLFLGLDTMKDAMSVLKEIQAFRDFIATAKNPVLGLVLGTIMCAIIQSSSASVGILQALAMQGLMPLEFAGYIICGVNIGSSTPVFLASLNAKNNAKRAAFVYFIFNLVGAVLFVPITMFTPFTSAIENICLNAGLNASFMVSLYHILFKVVAGVLLLILVKQVVNLTYKFVPKVEHETQMRFQYIDNNLIGDPNVAMVQTFKEIERMSDLVRENFQTAVDGLINNDTSKAEEIQEREGIINFLNENITDFLVKITALELSENTSNVVGNMFHVLNDLERIGDHSIALSRKTQEFVERQLIYSDTAKEEISTIVEKCMYLFDNSIQAFMNQRLDNVKAEELVRLDEQIDALAIQSQTNHIVRLRAHECHTEPGVIFAKALHDLERVGDYSINIAYAARKEAYLPREI